jgi:Xaa-Pro aminopeptidase
MKKYLPLDSQLFIDNRQKLAAQLPPKAMVIIWANDLMPRSGDQAFPFKQNADLYWLTGIDQEGTALILFPDCPNPMYREALFILETNELIAIWEGHKYTMEEARNASGISTVYWEKSFEIALPGLMAHCDHIYINVNENDRFNNKVPYKDVRFANQIREQYPAHNICRLSPIMQQLRTSKSAHEIAALKKACRTTRDAFVRVLQTLSPGMMEYEVEAEIIHEFIRQGATGHAYEPIIASGANACVLHYIANNKPCKDGDLILLDFGAEYANYAADLTRTIPVNGRFTQRQKDVYNAVLRVHKAARNMMRPGMILDTFNKEVGNIMASELISLRLLDKDAVARQDPQKPLYKKYFMHGTSHFLGLDVHDIGDRYAPIPENAVLTCEPGIYIREEGIGIRIENDILVTKDGPVDLMAEIPIEVEEIEEIMNRK